MNFVLAGRTIGAVLGRSAGTASNGLLTGLVAYWKLDEASGNAIDAHSNGLTLTAANAPGNAAGQVYASARTFNGSNQYFSRNSSATLQTGNIDFALAGWIYLTALSAASKTIVAKGSIGPTNIEFAIGKNSSDQLYFGGYNPTLIALVTYSSALAINTWTFFAAWHDAAASKLYLQMNNGTVAEQALSADIATNTAPFVIGAWPSVANLWPGRISPVAFWKNRTLSAADRSALWNGGNGLAYSAFS